LPQSGGTVLVVVVSRLPHGSGAQLPSPPVSMHSSPRTSLGFCGSQTNEPADVGRQQLMSWGVWRGVQPWSTASHQLAKALTQALPRAGATHFSAGTMAQRVRPVPLVRQQVTIPSRSQVERTAQRMAACIPPLDSRPAASVFAAWLTQRR